MIRLIICFLVIIVIGYLLGSINTTIIIGKIYGIDVKKQGSGNAGMTNAIRVLGKKPGIFVIIGDILKGVISCVIGFLIMKYFIINYLAFLPDLNIKDPDGLIRYGQIAGGFAAIAGHNWPLYFGFKGGKGVLTSFAVLVTVHTIPALICFGIFIIVVLISRYVSLGSMIAAFCFPFIAYAFKHDIVYLVLTVLLSLLIIFMHKGNIKRLINGSENKIFSKKKG